MKKTFCDICEKETKESFEVNAKYSVEKYIKVYGMSNETHIKSWESFEVCKECLGFVTDIVKSFPLLLRHESKLKFKELNEVQE